MTRNGLYMENVGWPCPFHHPDRVCGKDGRVTVAISCHNEYGWYLECEPVNKGKGIDRVRHVV